MGECIGTAKRNLCHSRDSVTKFDIFIITIYFSFDKVSEVKIAVNVFGCCCFFVFFCCCCCCCVCVCVCVCCCCCFCCFFVVVFCCFFLFIFLLLLFVFVFFLFFVCLFFVFFCLFFLFFCLFVCLLFVSYGPSHLDEISFRLLQFNSSFAFWNLAD